LPDDSRVRSSLILPTRLLGSVTPGKVEDFKLFALFDRRSWLRSRSHPYLLDLGRLHSSPCRSSTAIMSPMTPAPVSCTRLRAMARGFEAWMDHARTSNARGIDTAIPFTVDDAGFYTKDAPGAMPRARHASSTTREKGDANKRVIEALKEQDKLFALGRLKHTYPHSWRSKKPVIFRNTPQWFVYMDEDIEGKQGDTLRKRALNAIDATTFYPPAGQNRLRGMIENRPDWVLSRQRAWGVPITVFTHKETGEVLRDEAVNARIVEAFHAEGADAWFVRRCQSALPRQRSTRPTTGTGDRHSGCLVRFRLDPRLCAGQA
jgi:hypothetical protein